MFRGENPERMDREEVWDRIRIADGHQTDRKRMAKGEKKEKFHDLSF